MSCSDYWECDLFIYLFYIIAWFRCSCPEGFLFNDNSFCDINKKHPQLDAFQQGSCISGDKTPK